MHLTLMFTLLMLLQNGQEFYQQAMVQEHAAGNLEAAIQLYQDAARYAAGNRDLAAQALIGAARCYEKLGLAKARELYEEVARTYPDQKTYAAIAQDRAAALQPRPHLPSSELLKVEELKKALEDAARFRRAELESGLTNPNLWPVGPGMFWDRQPAPVPQFDTTSNGRMTFTGTITRVMWTNPNVIIDFNTKTRLLAGSPNDLFQNGWTRTSLRPGETVTVEGFQGVGGLQGRDPREPEVLMVCCGTITLSDGRKLSTGNPNYPPRPNQ